MVKTSWHSSAESCQGESQSRQKHPLRRIHKTTETVSKRSEKSEQSEIEGNENAVNNTARSGERRSLVVRKRNGKRKRKRKIPWMTVFLAVGMMVGGWR